MSNRPSNALIRETSPYLLQHAHNPVQWYPWGPEALARAVAEQKPILVSIGYSACHWCHVMEHESFEHADVAAIMNEHFINIKIDREERPDLDHIYMDAVQAMSGSGGWPLNVFLTPDKKPFYGGTYFPPQRAFNRPSWTEVLELIRKAWKEKREEIVSQADTLTDHLGKAGGLNALFAGGAPVSAFSRENCLTMAKNLLRQADPELGGFGKAPKFPQTFSIRYLIQQAWYERDPSLAHLALFSLRQLVNGGIYDQVGGGMCRYSTDDQWLVPHFEKMLYDNALLLRALADAWSFTGQDWYREAIFRTIGFLERELKSPEGGYYAALDADSEGEEGKFYVWSYDEVQSLLGHKAADFCTTFHITPGGNWEGGNILHVDDHLPSTGVDSPASVWEKELGILLEARNKRVRPGLDDKIILGWNAMLLSAFCRVYAATGQADMLAKAKDLAGFIEKTFYTSAGELLHTYKAGQARFPAFLDDHANYIEALILLGEVTGMDTYREQAYALMETVERKFSDAEQVFFYYTPEGQDDVIVRKLEWHDGATPSGNAVMAQNLLYLGIVFDKISVRERAAAMCSRLSEAILKYPSSFGIWAGVYQQLAYGMNEIILTGGEKKKMEEAIQRVLFTYIPNRVLMGSTAEKKDSMFAGKEFGDEITYYLCRDQHCLEPVKDVDNLLTLTDTESRRKLAIP